MKTRIIHKLHVLFFAIIAILSTLLITACAMEKNIVKKEITNIPNVLYVEEFDAEMNNIRKAIDDCNAKINVTYDDGTSEEIALTFDMLDDYSKQQLNSEGRHYISYEYVGEKISIEVNVQLAKTFTVRFYDVNNNIISEQKVRKGEAAIEPTEADRAVAGYIFVEWDRSFNKIIRDLDIHGIYEEGIYTVRFYDANKNIISEQQVKTSDTVVEPNEKERYVDGYVFVGWDKDFNNVTSDLDIYGIYNEEIYTVRFYDMNDNIISKQQVKKGESAVEPTATEREVEGYTFVAWDTAFDNVTGDLEIHGIYEKKFIVTFYNSRNVIIDTQYVAANDNASEPSDSAKYIPGYIFLKWDTELTNIKADTSIYGIYVNDNTTDTDGDGIIDYIEVEILNLDYTKVDTDGDGVTDDKEDFDNDGLFNLTEIKNGLKPNDPDTDDDGLTDGDEIDTYWTLPEDPDTDGDGANDGWEIQNNFDPLNYNDSFEVKVSVALDNNTNVDVDIPELSGEFVDTPIVELSTDESIQTVAGSISETIQYNVSATASITFESEAIATAEDPVLMYFNTATKEVEPISISRTGNKATASIAQYGNYTLVDRKVFEEKGQWRDIFTSNSYVSAEVVFVIDDSGSMNSNDPTNVRLTVAKDLIDHLPDGTKIGIVRFDSSVTALTSSLTTSKSTAKNYLTTSHFESYGLTLLYSGAMTGLNLYSTQTINDGIFRVMILISDGYPEGSDSYTQQNVISNANSNNVKIYTVGLGNNSSYFENTLNPLSEQTGATYTHSSDASALNDIYAGLGEKIDMELDTDNDGLADFFESAVDKDGKPVLPTIDGKSFEGLDKENPDTDNDGFLDGVEIEIYKYYSDSKPDQVMVWGIVNSDPTDATSVPQA